MSFINVSEQSKEAEQKNIVLLMSDKLSISVDSIITQCLHQAGISRSDVSYIYLKNPRWNIELIQTKPKVVITVDDAPLRALTHRDSSWNFRGSPIFKDEYTVIPIINPSICLGVYINRYYIIADMRKALRIATTPNYQRPNKTLLINPSYEETISYLTNIKENKKEIAFDIECCNQEVSCISFATSPQVCMSIPFFGNPWTEREECEIWKLITAILFDKTITKIGQNLMFDIAFLYRQNNIVTQGLIEDTMIAHNTIYKDFPKGLDFLCSIYTDEEYYKDYGKIWKDPSKDLNKFYRYNALDSAVTFECWLKIKKDLLDKKFMPLYRRIMEVFEPLLYMQLKGMKTIHSDLDKRRDDVNIEIGNLQAKLNKLCGFELNVNSSKQCQQYFYVTKGLAPYTKDGKITTDDKAMTRIARKGYEEARIIQDIRERRKLVSTYLDIAFDPDGRLRSSYNLAGTSFGRLASSQTIFGTGCNFQNIPTDFRTFMVADPGYVLIEFDKVQAEWIVVAYLANDANMIEVVEKKLDAHIKTAELMFGAPDALIKADDKLLKKITGKENILAARKEHLPEILKCHPIETMSCRQIGKKCNHGLNYDLGYKGFALASDIEEVVAKRIVEMYHNAYPGIRNTYHWRVREQLGKDRTPTNSFGRKRIFMDRWGDTLFKAAYSLIPQSSVGDMVNISIAAIYKDKTSIMMKLQLLGQVHDSIVCQYPLDSLPDLYYAIKIMKEYMDIPMTYNARTFIIPTDCKI